MTRRSVQTDAMMFIFEEMPHRFPVKHLADILTIRITSAKSSFPFDKFQPAPPPRNVAGS